MDYQKLISVEEVAKILKISNNTVYYYATKGAIPYIRIGRHIRFCVKEIEAWLRKKSGEEK